MCPMNESLNNRLNQIMDRITSPEFLSGSGLGNEIGFYIFDYPPEDELTVREYVRFMLENLAKPVISTGSQLPIGLLRTDGRENLLTAIEIASTKENGLPLVPEVCIFFDNELTRGNRTTKFSAEHFDAFNSPNYPPLAEVGLHLKYNYTLIRYPDPRNYLICPQNF